MLHVFIIFISTPVLYLSVFFNDIILIVYCSKPKDSFKHNKSAASYKASLKY